MVIDGVNSLTCFVGYGGDIFYASCSRCREARDTDISARFCPSKEVVRHLRENREWFTATGSVA
jgi:hypothetical protein